MIAPRNACAQCKCGFDEDPNLFPELTSSRVHQALEKIRSPAGMAGFLKENRLQLSRGKGGEIIFPHGLCQSVQNKIRLKIDELKIPIGPSTQKEFDLLPAAGPDDLPLPITIGIKGPLSWSETGISGNNTLAGISLEKIASKGMDDWLDPKNAWKGSPEEVHLDA